MINGWLNIIKSGIKQIVSWIVPLAFTVVVTYVLKVGFLVEQPFVNVAIFSAGAGLVSNGIFDIGFVGQAVNWIVNKITKT